MKRISTLLLFLLTLLTGYAQNPFATYGYKPKMATLSNGRFDEFHDKDRIIEIGSVKFASYKRNIFSRLFNPGIARKMIFHSDTPLLVIYGRPN